MSKSNESSLAALRPVEQYVKRQKSATIAGLRSLGLSRPSLYRAIATLVAQGRLVRVERGLYQPASKIEVDSWVVVQRQYTKGVVCLLSALAFHNLTTQSPREVWARPAEKRMAQTGELSAGANRSPFWPRIHYRYR